MKRSLFLLALGLSACGVHAGPFRVAALPLPGATPAPAAVEPSALSGTAKPRAAKARGSATATPSPTPAPLLYLAPMEDRRAQRVLWRGRSRYDDVSVEAEGISLSSKTWQERPYGSIALLWHRQLAATFDSGDLRARAAEEPIADADTALHAAGDLGAKYLLSGKIEVCQIEKAGADAVFGTNFSGTNYTYLLKLRLKLVEVSSGQAVMDGPWEYSHRFFDPSTLGNSDINTFPSFFLQGQRQAAEALAGDTKLRALAGLPALTATPSKTPTPMVTPPTPGPSPTPVATAAPTPVPTPDGKPYWVNPKTGKRVDPKWNFDPEDGTPRKDFILRQPTPQPTPKPTLKPTPQTTPARPSAPR